MTSQITKQINRRDFLKNSSVVGAAVAGLGVWSELSAAESSSPNEKLNIACIGTGNQAAANISGVSSQNIVALCDIDDNFLSKAASQYPKARKYNDFRKMLDQEEKQIDAVVVATPDHVHASASVMAIRLGKHCYCEKPLTHAVFEARVVAEAAKKEGVATQLGTQIHAGNNYRRVVEIIQSGVIGSVSEVHVWVNARYGGGDRPQETPPVPSHVHCDLWLGPAAERPYHPTYHPFSWRGWWDFGQGGLGDFGCHYMDLPFWALKLRHPTSVQAHGPKVHPETCPQGLIVNYEFPARGDLSPVKLTWYDGVKIPRQVAGHQVPGSGVMFLGSQGHLYANYGSYKLYPEEKFADFTPPEPTIPNSIGHHLEWIKACKDGSPTTCNFDYSGALTETVLLGNVSFRTGKRLQWDAVGLKATNCPQAERYIRPTYRKGWTL